MPPCVNKGIRETVGEAQNGQWAGNGKLDAAATRRRLLPVAGHVHAAGDEIGHPSDYETSGGEQDHLDRLPLGQRFIAARGNSG